MKLTPRARPRILVVGDAMLDRDLIGVVERISPEAPVPVVRLTGETERLGGAASVAKRLADVECEVIFVGCTGADAAGEAIELRLREAGVLPHLIVDPTRPTTVKTRVVADKDGRRQPLLRLDSETTNPIDQKALAAVLERTWREIPVVDVMLASDYGKGVLSTKLFAQLAASANRSDAPLLVDPAKGKPIENYRGASLVKLNRQETAAAAGRKIETPEQAVQAAHEIRVRLSGAAVVVTLDRDGAVIVDDEGEAIFRAATSDARDVTGAGDAVLATLGFAAASGYSYRDGLRAAMQMAGRCVEKSIGQNFTRDELIHALQSTQQETTLGVCSRKIILDHKRLAERLGSLQQAGRRVVFTNGCFDLLHVGHLTTLETARRAGDALVVAINSDESVARLKGPSRPITPASERAALLAALASVDFVTIFDEDDPERLIRRLRPDVIVKGGDYCKETIAGAKSVAARGGRVIVAPLVPDRSSTLLATAAFPFVID
ncbi:MAG TPA: PfkB family carbohydrate kinase [Pirellulales bacterium]